jgi:hypothetical protein
MPGASGLYSVGAPGAGIAAARAAAGPGSAAGAATSAGVARASINRAIGDNPAPQPDSGEHEHEHEDEQNLDRLVEQVFARIRWRLAVERERHMA